MSDVCCPKCRKGTLNEYREGIYICNNCSYETDEKEIIHIYVQRMRQERETIRNYYSEDDDEFHFDIFRGRYRSFDLLDRHDNW